MSLLMGTITSMKFKVNLPRTQALNDKMSYLVHSLAVLSVAASMNISINDQVILSN